MGAFYHDVSHGSDSHVGGQNAWRVPLSNGPITMEKICTLHSWSCMWCALNIDVVHVCTFKS